jgi:hypothetical protein
MVIGGIGLGGTRAACRALPGFWPGLHVPTKYESRYGLLKAFADQFCAAWGVSGGEVNPPLREGVSSVFLFFNNPSSPQALHQWMGPVLGPRAVVQWCVDHPLTLPAAHVDRYAAIPGYRLVMVGRTTCTCCRCAGRRSAQRGCGTAWTPARCATRGAITGGREFDLVIAGSIASEAAIDEMRGVIPGALRSGAEEIIALRTRYPQLSFGQAWDAAMPRLDHPGDHWNQMSAVFQYTTAVVNRTRRTALVKAMLGVRTRLLGTETLRALCGGTVEYGGECAYADVPRELARAKVCLALGPTQFVQSFSERLLLSLAAGCATVADARVSVEQEFGMAGCVEAFDVASPEAARAAVEALLKDDTKRVEMGRCGRRAVAQGHLWTHRVPTIAGFLHGV